MPEHKHTPGPWVIHKADDDYCIASVGNLVIMPTAGKVKHDNSEADARLIAAAPDLLKALEATNLLLRTKRHACENSEVCAVLDVHINRNNAAIAKATGQA